MDRTTDPLRPGVMHQAIQDRIKQFIITNGFQSGDALPPETELARDLGISRGSLREAMKSLQTLGVVETRHGLGTFVGRFSFDPLIDGLTFQILVSREKMPRAIRELLDLRQILETGLMPRVTDQATREQIAQLDQIVSEMERLAEEGSQFAAEDRAFHDALYSPLGNNLVIELLQAFWHIFAAVGQESSRRTVLLRETAEEHRAILNAIAAGEGKEAARAMSAHFAGALEWVPLLEQSEAEPVVTVRTPE
jgi:DNA-binding FadR family transcriptional regulator